MIDQIQGEIVSINETSCVLLSNNIGFEIFVSELTLQELELNEEITLLTSLQVREDSLTLYGFLNNDDRQLYNLFNSVTGIGPKVALSLLSTAEGVDLREAILLEDVAFLTQAPGIGKKSAERIILELKDKLGKYTWEEVNAPVKRVKASPKSPNRKAAIDGLMGLGYSKREAKEALVGVDDDLSVEEMLRLGLKALSR